MLQAPSGVARQRRSPPDPHRRRIIAAAEVRFWSRRTVHGSASKEQLVVAFGTAAPGELRKYYREQVQDLVYGAMSK